MDKKLQFKRPASGVAITAYTPVAGEPLYDPVKKQIRIGDGSTPGGVLPREMTFSPITNASIYNAAPYEVIPVDCSTNSITIMLPNKSECSLGTTVRVIDVKGAAGTDPLGTGEFYIHVDGNGSKIHNDTSADPVFHIDAPGSCIDFTYVPSTDNWLINIGGSIFPSVELDFTDELGINNLGQIAINHVDASKITGTGLSGSIITAGTINSGSF